MRQFLEVIDELLYMQILFVKNLTPLFISALQDWTGLNFQQIMAEADTIKTTVSDKVLCTY